MFWDTFSATTNSDNRFNFLKDDSAREITIGGDCIHTFEFDFIYSDLVASAEAIYKQGLTKIFSFNITDVVSDTVNNKSYINVALSKTDTLAFTSTNLDTYVQLKFTLLNGDTIFSDKHKVIIKEPLRQLLR